MPLTTPGGPLGRGKLVTPKAYSPLSVAFEHPKSSVPPAQAASANTGKAIAVAVSPTHSFRFISLLHLIVNSPVRCELGDTSHARHRTGGKQSEKFRCGRGLKTDESV